MAIPPAALLLCWLQAQAQQQLSAGAAAGVPDVDNAAAATAAPGYDGGVAADGAAAPAAPSVVPPALKRFVAAVYPPAAEKAGVTGAVTLSIVIDATGSVTDLKVVDPGPDPGFAPAAVAAVKQFQFSPALIDGKPTAVEISYRYEFVLKKPPPAAAAPTEKPVSLIGRVIERGTREPVAGASIDAEGVTGETDANGRFTLRGLPPGFVRIRLVETAHHDLTVPETIEAGKVREVEYRMNRRRYGAFESVVRGERERKELAVHEVGAAEISTVPGTQGDVLKVLQDFPGVARAPFGLGLLIVRGSAPQDTKVYLDGIEIPLLFHFGALTAVVGSDIISGLDFYPGNFASNYGDAMGGTVEIHTRDPKHTWHGVGQVDLYDGEAMVEGPVGDGSFFLAVRRSWVDQVLKAVVPSGLTVAPVFYDYQAKYVHELWGGQGQIFVFGSSDALDILDANTARQISFDSEIQFHRVSARWQRGFRHDWRNDAVLSAGYDDNDTEAVNAIKLDVQQGTLALRDTLSYRPSDRFALEMGTDSALHYFWYDIALPRVATVGNTGAAFTGGGGIAGNPSHDVAANGGWAQPALFATALWTPLRRLRLQPGVRLDGNTRIGGPHDWWVDPRLSVFFTAGPKTVLKAGVGLYSESPQPGQLTPAVFGNAGLGWQHSLQYSLGVAQQLPWQSDIDVELYDKYMYDLVTATRLADANGNPLYLSNLGKGRSYGLELMLRRRIMKGFYGWIAYTLSRSERLDDPTTPTYQYGWHLYDFDQTHILTAVASYQTEHNWTFGTRVRYVSGDPYTPYANGIFNASNASYSCIDGNPDSRREPPFFQADVRVDRRWVYDKWTFTGYLDVQNVTNRQNPEAIFANYNCQGYATLTGLPIFPTLGFRAEF
jgi:TonB family protein